MLDSKISKIKKDFNNAHEILANSKINLMQANIRLKTAKLETSKIIEDYNKELKIASKHLELDLESKLKKLYSNHQEILHNLHHSYYSNVKKRIIEKVCDKMKHECEINKIAIKQYNLENLAKSEQYTK
jgi:F0F1-type ATP synthase membrane subunit b/b'